MRCPEQHTKSPKEILVEEICLILINLRCVLIMHGKNTPQKIKMFLYSYQNETLHNESTHEKYIFFFVLQVSLKIHFNMQMSNAAMLQISNAAFRLASNLKTAWLGSTCQGHT